MGHGCSAGLSSSAVRHECVGDLHAAVECIVVKLVLWSQTGMGLHLNLELEANYFTAMKFSFPIYKVGVMMIMAVPGVWQGSNKSIYAKPWLGTGT